MTLKAAMIAGALVVVSTAVSAQNRGAAAALTPQDYYAIQQLYARFVHGLDSGAANGALFAGVFTLDGVFVDETGRTIEGRDQLAAYARANGRGPTHVGHYVANSMIDASPDGATAKSYVMLAVGQGDSRYMANAGQYWDELVKMPDGWRIRRRTYQKSPLPAPAAPPVPAR